MLEDKTLPEKPVGNRVELDKLDRRFYRSQYLQAVQARQGLLSPEMLEGLRNNYRANGQELSLSERILSFIWKVSRLPLVARIISIMPFKMQQAIKRRFSSRPMHDIVGK